VEKKTKKGRINRFTAQELDGKRRNKRFMMRMILELALKIKRLRGNTEDL
jgi:hypothetical protein